MKIFCVKFHIYCRHFKNFFGRIFITHSNLNVEELPSEVNTDRQVGEFWGAQPDMTKPVSGHTDDPSTAVADLRVVESTSCMAGHTTKEIEIAQDSVISHLNPHTPHFVPHQQVPSMAAVGDSSIRTQSDTYHNPHGPCQTNAVASPVLSVNRNMAPRNDLYLEQAQVDEERNPEKSLVGLAKCLAKQVSLSRLPPPEPSIFNGDPMRYPCWKAAFLTLIEHQQIPTVERIHYLKKYLGGQVKDTVKGYFLLPPEDALDKAKKLLEEHYGNPFVMPNAFRDKLEKWQRINSRDGAALQRYADFLRQCHTAMRSIGNLSVLNDVRENRKMLGKLPEWAITKWVGIVDQHRQDKGDFPPFKAFVEFITKQARIATDPVTSLQSIRFEQVGVMKDRPLPNKWRQPLQTFVTIDEGHTKDMPARKLRCNLCPGIHELEACMKFKAMNIADKKQFAREKRLCFACL